jgi:tRNA-dihydrouridine synthase B
MAGVTDRPLRTLARRLGAGLAVSEMTTSDPSLLHTGKSRLRRDHAGESGPVSVQIAGYDPQMMADAARFNVDHGAQIIDINMGCPAKKVCRVDAGSALMRDEPRVAAILSAVVQAVDVPVTLKIRTGWSRERRNGVAIARIAQDCGIQALAVHGRTREDRFDGAAEYDTLAAIRDAIAIPLIANGDIGSPQKARAVLAQTGADAVMVGRAALGRPWIFREIAHHLATGGTLAPPTRFEVRRWLLEHLDALYVLYGERQGTRVARKHIQWYCEAGGAAPEARAAFWASINRVESPVEQRARVDEFFSETITMTAA